MKIVAEELVNGISEFTAYCECGNQMQFHEAETENSTEIVMCPNCSNQEFKTALENNWINWRLTPHYRKVKALLK